jgi:hypothetical protein
LHQIQNGNKRAVHMLYRFADAKGEKSVLAPFLYEPSGKGFRDRNPGDLDLHDAERQNRTADTGIFSPFCPVFPAGLGGNRVEMKRAVMSFSLATAYNLLVACWSR